LEWRVALGNSSVSRIPVFVQNPRLTAKTARGGTISSAQELENKRAMSTRTPPILVWLYLTASIAGQEPLAHSVASLLPSDARVIETAQVSIRAAKTRVLVLWMSAPRRVISEWDSAADTLYGDHWFGPTFLSLIDPSTAKLINTVTIRPNEESSDDGDGLSIPFFTYNFFYYVPHPDKDRKGRPLLLRLQDLTGEGVAGQFVLFDHVASGIAAGSVLGYSSRSDTAVQYAVESIQNRFEPVVQFWAVQVFDRKPLRAGYWKFTWEAGHGEWDWIDEEVHFDPARQLFVERSTTRPYPGYAQVYCSLDSASLTSFLGRMREIAPSGIDAEWLKDMITNASPNSITAAGLVPVFNGTQETLTVGFQVSARGAIGIELSTGSRFAAALRANLQTWCGAK
jgi:hypothetical protein